MAKALAGGPPSGDKSESPTITRDATETGVILGTAAYMSPEQARGKAVDKRADIWAFGCCLYESLTGHSPFVGETVTDTLAAIVNREPDWEALPGTTPAKVREVLRRCLRKDLHRRLRDVGDARIDFEDALSETPIPGVPVRPAQWWKQRSFWVGAGLVAVNRAGNPFAVVYPASSH